MIFLFTTFKRFGFGPVFCTRITILYTAPHASVRTNKVTSSFFPVSRGTRQGCLLSPLLFDIAIEVLTMNLFISQYLLLNLIGKFGQVSGYRLNLSKSVIFPINKKGRQMTFHSLPFIVSKDSFDYLAVCIAYDLFNKNFTKALNKDKTDMEKWSKLPIGRINSVKMTILPKFLYLFQTIPVFIPKKFFKELNKHISRTLTALVFLASAVELPRRKHYPCAQSRDNMGPSLQLKIHKYN
uniref:Uncharacterized protein n=1 Tax=Xiphophorus maculatus TaxID=8083 RepID=A0A3B5QKK8_XIPMA